MTSPVFEAVRLDDVELAPAPIDPSIDKWFYISGASA